MPSANKLILIGNLTRDIALKYLPSQTPLAECGIAVNRKYKTASGEQKEEVCFVDFSCFGKSAETLNQYVKKGDPIYLEGRLSYDQWEDKNGGGKRSKLSMIVENFQFLSNRQGDDGGQQQTPAGVRRPTMAQEMKDRARGKAPVGDPFPDGQEFKDDDIPF